MSRLLGITVMPEWIQAEGVERVLDNLELAGANAVATSPYVMAPSSDPSAGREPPVDAGAGKVRLLDRDLWGKRELRCTTSPSFVPDRALYEGLRYQPAEHHRRRTPESRRTRRAPLDIVEFSEFINTLPRSARLHFLIRALHGPSVTHQRGPTKNRPINYCRISLLSRTR